MKRIGIYAGKNLLRIILLLFAVSILTFALVSASPIDPLQANVGQAALGSMSEKQKEEYKLISNMNSWELIKSPNPLLMFTNPISFRIFYI